MKILSATSLAALFALTSTAAFGRGRVNCDGEVGQVLGDLNKLRTENDKVRSLCEGNLEEAINKDTAFGRFPGGDCEQTYGVVNKLSDRVEDKLEEACNAFQSGLACRTSNHAQCFGTSSELFQQSGTKLREALSMLRMAQKVLKKRVDHNEKDVNEYARLGEFDPGSVLGNPPSTITGDGMRYFKLAREQAQSMRQGMEFIEKAGPVEKKLNAYQAKLNSMGATTAQRQQNIGQTGSTITGNTSKPIAAELLGQQVLMGPSPSPGTPGAAATPPRGFRESDFLMKEGEGEMSEEQFFSALDGKPLGINVAAKMPGEGKAGQDTATSETASAANQPGQGAPAGKPEKEAAPGTSQLDNDSAKLAAADLGAFQRNIASLPVKAEDGGAGQTGNFSGASAARKGSNAAVSGLESSNGNKKLMASGPSLRELLKERLTSGDGATRAMHEVLGGIQDQADKGEQNEAGTGKAAHDEQADAAEIKGIDSEPLFVRVRAAHLRYQKTHVKDM